MKFNYNKFLTIFKSYKLKNLLIRNYLKIFNEDECILYFIADIFVSNIISVPTIILREIENHIFNKAIQNKYLENKDIEFLQLQRITIDYHNEKDSIIDIPNLATYLWEDLMIMNYFKQVANHRQNVFNIYKYISSTLKIKMKKINDDILQFYGLEKFNLKYAISYTWQNIHQEKWHPVTIKITNKFVYNSLYYPQAWKIDTNNISEYDYNRLKNILKFNYEHMPIDYLYISLFNIIATVQESTTQFYLSDISIPEEYFNLYMNNDKKILKKLIKKIKQKDAKYRLKI